MLRNGTQASHLVGINLFLFAVLLPIVNLILLIPFRSHLFTHAQRKISRNKQVRYATLKGQGMVPRKWKHEQSDLTQSLMAILELN